MDIRAKEKLRNVIAYFVSHWEIRDKLHLTLKLYYLDFYSLAKRGRPVTELTYRAGQHGPTADIEDVLVDTVEEVSTPTVRSVMRLVHGVEFSDKLLSSTEIKMMNEVLNAGPKKFQAFFELWYKTLMVKGFNRVISPEINPEAFEEYKEEQQDKKFLDSVFVDKEVKI